MPTRRTPIKHQHSPRLKISDEMLAIYAKMRAIRCTCTPEIFPPDAGWEEWEECAHCQRWDDLNRLLLRMVGKAVPCHEFAVTTPPRCLAVEPDRAAERARAFEEALAGHPGKTPA
jgi:hypothetical protein